MPNDNIFIDKFSDGLSFSTNIKTINKNDLVYGSIRPYFKKAGFKRLIMSLVLSTHLTQNEKMIIFGFCLVFVLKNFTNTLSPIHKVQKCQLLIGTLLSISSYPTLKNPQPHCKAQ